MKDDRCVIIGGADISDYAFVLDKIRDDDFLIYCDSGLKHMAKLGCDPDLIVGDFDSYSDPHMDVETIVLPRIKDDTDTMYAIKEGIKRGFDEFLLIGVVGARLDHSLGNVYGLLYLDSAGKHGVLIDDYSEMEIVSQAPVYIPDSYQFFSLINITGTAKGIDIKNAKYELSDGEITPEYQYGISNEVIPNKKASVSVSSGRLLLVKVMNNDSIKKSFNNAIKSLYQLMAAIDDETDSCHIIDYNPEIKNIEADLGDYRLLCKNLFINVHPDDREDFRRFTSNDYFPDELKKEVYISKDVRIRHTDGRYYWSEVMFCHASVEDGISGHEYMFLIRDIHEKKSAELKREAETRTLINELQSKYEEIFLENMVDAQTGCFNRKGMKYYSDMVINLARESKKYLFVCVADLNGLKYINDTYGHQAGDEAISAISKALLESAPAGSRIVRTGGDEFLLFAALDKESDKPEKMGGILDKKVEEYNSTHSNEYTVGVSYGYVFLPVKPDMIDLDEYIGIADAKMYDMKFSRDEHRRE